MKKITLIATLLTTLSIAKAQDKSIDVSFGYGAPYVGVNHPHVTASGISFTEDKDIQTTFSLGFKSHIYKKLFLKTEIGTMSGSADVNISFTNSYMYSPSNAYVLNYQWIGRYRTEKLYLAFLPEFHTSNSNNYFFVNAGALIAKDIVNGFESGIQEITYSDNSRVDTPLKSVGTILHSTLGVAAAIGGCNKLGLFNFTYGLNWQYIPQRSIYKDMPSFGLSLFSIKLGTVYNF